MGRFGAELVMGLPEHCPEGSNFGDVNVAHWVHASVIFVSGLFLRHRDNNMSANGRKGIIERFPHNYFDDDSVQRLQWFYARQLIVSQHILHGSGSDRISTTSEISVERTVERTVGVSVVCP